jgi:nitroreductase
MARRRGHNRLAQVHNTSGQAKEWNMETIETIRGRKSVRAFLPRPVSRETINRILEISRWAPSGSNRQTWRVTVATGAPRETLVARLLERARARQAEAPARVSDEPAAPRNRERLMEQIAGAAQALGLPLREFLMAGSYSFYGAPVALIVSSVGAGPADVAPFITTLLLAAHDEGLGTCWLGMPLAYPEIIREVLAMPEDWKLAGAVALGYPDLASPANAFRSERTEVETFTRWVGFEDR